MKNSSIIQFENLGFSYNEATETFRRLNLEITEHDFVAVIGPSGCGKSTLLRLVCGLIEPGEGSVLAGGSEVTGPGPDRAVVFQDYSLFPWLTCRANIVLALEQVRRGRDKAERVHLADQYLNMVGLHADGGKLPGELSGGMRQRAAIARALAIDAPVLLMDEPFGALDAITRARQQDMLLDLWQAEGERRKTVLFVTHDVDEALILANRVIVLGMKPTGIAADIRVTLPRPRSRSAALADPGFVALRDRLLDELNDAVSRQLNAAAQVSEGGGI